MPDSSFFVRQARRALGDSAAEESRATLRADSYQVIVVESLEQGVIVSLVSRPPRLGGGGLVWVDIETRCPIVLRRYE